MTSTGSPPDLWKSALAASLLVLAGIAGGFVLRARSQLPEAWPGPMVYGNASLEDEVLPPSRVTLPELDCALPMIDLWSADASEQMENAVGGRVRVVGVADRHKRGPMLSSPNSHASVELPQLADWPADVAGRRVVAEGVLVMEYYPSQQGVRHRSGNALKPWPQGRVYSLRHVVYCQIVP